jgi:hypothetical protein
MRAHRVRHDRRVHKQDALRRRQEHPQPLPAHVPALAVDPVTGVLSKVPAAEQMAAGSRADTRPVRARHLDTAGRIGPAALLEACTRSASQVTAPDDLAQMVPFDLATLAGRSGRSRRKVNKSIRPPSMQHPTLTPPTAGGAAPSVPPTTRLSTPGPSRPHLSLTRRRRPPPGSAAAGRGFAHAGGQPQQPALTVMSERAVREPTNL